MFELNAVLTVAFAGLLLSASPGPSMAYVLSRSVQYGVSGGMASSLGLAMGGVLHAFFAAMGLSLLAVKFPWLLQLVKYAGAIYLLYLAYDSFMSATKIEEDEIAELNDTSEAEISVIRAKNIQAQQTSIGKNDIVRLFINGIIIELSNPKTIIFFLSFMPQFVENKSTSAVFFLSALIPITAIPADLLAIFAGGMIANRLRQRAWVTRSINFAVALVLLVIALLVLI
ncbi:LysE family translocator [Undibacterium fentianense]|uniref:LysE family translocator n=1 Tax=Undibacterium fentianense TaxID=2828728 RepID=A0A941E2S0_9BURK|nr:LysE family translocator [Undibacterium fentianense]MBR7799589.1 LysE family translocator [Undibacterium fentianense]